MSIFGRRESHAQITRAMDRIMPFDQLAPYKEGRGNERFGDVGRRLVEFGYQVHATPLT
jgi:hypothetical protein